LKFIVYLRYHKNHKYRPGRDSSRKKSATLNFFFVPAGRSLNRRLPVKPLGLAGIGAAPRIKISCRASGLLSSVAASF
jgi:hypothetical protein